MKTAARLFRRILVNPQTSAFGIAAVIAFGFGVYHDPARLQDPLAWTAALAGLAHLFSQDATSDKMPPPQDPPKA